MTGDESSDLRRALDEVHRAFDGEPPSFAATLEAARRRMRGRGERPRPRWRLAAAMIAVVLTLVGIGLFDRRRPAELDPAEALQLAESLSVWHGPTDFLHRPPGAELLETFPRLHLTSSLTITSPAAERPAAGEMEDAP